MKAFVFFIFAALLAAAIYLAFSSTPEEAAFEAVRTSEGIEKRSGGAETGQDSLDGSRDYKNPFELKGKAPQRTEIQRSAGFSQEVDEIIALIDSGQLEDVENRLKALVQKNPNDGQILSVLGDWYMEQGRFDDSQKIFEQAIKLRPTDATLRIDLAKVHILTGNQIAAIQSYKEAAELNPHSREAVSGLVSTFAISGKLEEAKNYLKGFSEAHPDSMAAYEALATHHLAEGDHPAATKVLERAYKVNPHDPMVNATLAGLYIQTNRIPEGVALLENTAQHIESKPSLSEEEQTTMAGIYQTLYALYDSSGKKKEAEVARQKLEQYIGLE